ncbi:hypothetical protein CISG_02840 [Coccidioides immitis RMSCC 3703]|uniref:BCD1 alpha/beta domain-containing protein n=1 Tax=Coccidioides immitis RMSCC 3703 TaxID=454286 RepID=A0A0J8R9R8_COCIT|nr:hypothetical protein CISG_02840 [Coccidioides immitis RMSCC 3703]
MEIGENVEKSISLDLVAIVGQSIDRIERKWQDLAFVTNLNQQKIQAVKPRAVQVKQRIQLNPRQAKNEVHIFLPSRIGFTPKLRKHGRGISLRAMHDLRHKLWSQCSGVRDPAAYLKRKELATPAAFDKDFNFITEIERCLERADRDAENRGIMLEDEERSKKKRRTGEFTKGEALLRRIEESGVDVIRAPKGMTRSRQNMSQWHKKHKCVNWTVE